MPRISTLTYDRGTLLLHPPPKGKAWVEHAEWDDRVEKFRLPADRYRPPARSPGGGGDRRG